ncbi:anti-sigma factor [Mumia qirimensis]|uniref:anti-sigma factor n=1 Tax=Mumia qirimensis TaxID=3234852 RepID=UPI00351D16D4
MSHPDEELRAAYAMGDPVDDDTSRHIEECDECSGDVAELARTLRAADLLTADRPPLVSPPPEVWTRIQSAVAEPAPGASPPGTVVPFEHRSRRREVAIRVTAFVAGVAAAVVGMLLVVDRGEDPSDGRDDGSVVASGDLIPLEGQSAQGTATVVDDGGTRRVTIDLADTGSPGSGFFQAWLLDPTTNGMIALGVMDQDSETFAVPSGVDLAAYDSVDISLEPFDGDPAHSATSVARGRLAADG